MDTIELGEASSGAVVHLDKFAHEADGIIVLGRTTTHPENTEGIASGLLKMTTVGLGKQRGAQEAHRNGLWESVRAVPEVTLAKSKIIFGVTVVENALREAAMLEVVPGDYRAFRETDERLLDEAKKYAAKLPYSFLDLLIVDEMGKNISGTGMDLNVIGKWRMSGGEKKPDYRRIVPLSLTSESLGNAIGLGLADFTTRRLAEQVDQQATLINILTATEPGETNSIEGGIPPIFENDREAIEVPMYSALPSGDPKVIRIKSTGMLDEFWISSALIDQTEENPCLTIDGSFELLRFDAAGNLF